MFCPRVHQEYLHKPISSFGIAIDPPPIRAIATPQTGVLAEGLHKHCLLPRNDGVFDCDQHRTLKKFSADFFDDYRHAPMIPRSEICCGIWKLGHQRNNHTPNGSKPGIYKGQSNALSLGDTTPDSTTQCITPHIDES